MSGDNQVPFRRDLLCTAAWTAAVAALLGSACGGVKYRGHLRAFYHAARALAAHADRAPDWLDKLGEAGPEAAPACRWAYRNFGNPYLQRRAAQALGRCTGLSRFLAFAEREGLDSPATRELLDTLGSAGHSGIELPEAAPFCLRAYASSPDEADKGRAAAALAGCAGLPALLELVREAGTDTPAEYAFIARLSQENVHGKAPLGVMVIEQDLSPPESGGMGPKEKLVFSGRIGNYEVEVYHTWWVSDWGPRSGAENASGETRAKRLAPCPSSMTTRVVRRGPDGTPTEFHGPVWDVK